VVLLRVECHDKNSLAYNETFKDFNMIARSTNKPIIKCQRRCNRIVRVNLWSKKSLFYQL
jgi:hypothetical protein